MLIRSLPVLYNIILTCFSLALLRALRYNGAVALVRSNMIATLLNIGLDDREKLGCGHCQTASAD